MSKHLAKLTDIHVGQSDGNGVSHQRWQPFDCMPIIKSTEERILTIFPKGKRVMLSLNSIGSLLMHPVCWWGWYTSHRIIHRLTFVGIPVAFSVRYESICCNIFICFCLLTGFRSYKRWFVWSHHKCASSNARRNCRRLDCIPMFALWLHSVCQVQCWSISS